MKTFTLKDFDELMKDQPRIITLLDTEYLNYLNDAFTAKDILIEVDFGSRKNQPFVTFYYIDHQENTEVDLAEITGNKDINTFIKYLLER